MKSKLYSIFILLSSFPHLWGCAITATRPVQEMSNTAAAIRAANEVQASTLAPELYQQSREWYFKAKREYRFKNFLEAKEYAKKARTFAERAEFESLLAGGNRDVAPPDPLADSVGQESDTPGGSDDEFASPEPLYYESAEQQEQFQKQIELEKAKRPVFPQSPTNPNPSQETAP